MNSQVSRLLRCFLLQSVRTTKPRALEQSAGPADRAVAATPGNRPANEGKVSSWTGWRSEDSVGADASPNNVRLAGHALVAIAEGGSTVAIPCHIEDARVSGHALYPQSWPERAVWSRKVRYESFRDHLTKGGLLLRCEFLPVSLKAGKDLKRGHQASEAPRPSR